MLRVSPFMTNAIDDYYTVAINSMRCITANPHDYNTYLRLLNISWLYAVKTLLVFVAALICTVQYAFFALYSMIWYGTEGFARMLSSQYYLITRL